MTDKDSRCSLIAIIFNIDCTSSVGFTSVLPTGSMFLFQATLPLTYLETLDVYKNFQIRRRIGCDSHTGRLQRRIR